MKSRFIPLLLAVVILMCGCSASEGVGWHGNLFSGRSSKKEPESDPGEISENAPEPIYDISIDLNRDPVNSRQLRLSNGVLTISGNIGDVGVDEILALGCTVELTRSGNKFTCTISDPPAGKGYINIEVVNHRCQLDVIRLRYTDGRLAFPNVMKIADNNGSVISGSIPDDSEAIRLQNITINGKSKNAQAVLDDVKRLSDRICFGLTNDYDKLRAISRWVSENIYYDHPAYAAGIPAYCVSLEYVMKYKRSVCGGYANMTAALAQAQGILCYNIAGEAVSNFRCYSEVSRGEPHEWNYAFVNGRSVWVDSGWNAFNHYMSDDDVAQGDIGIKYFDIGSELLALDHKVTKISDRNFYS